MKVTWRWLWYLRKVYCDASYCKISSLIQICQSQHNRTHCKCVECKLHSSLWKQLLISLSICHLPAACVSQSGKLLEKISVHYFLMWAATLSQVGHSGPQSSTPEQLLAASSSTFRWFLRGRGERTSLIRASESSSSVGSNGCGWHEWYQSETDWDMSLVSSTRGVCVCDNRHRPQWCSNFLSHCSRLEAACVAPKKHDIQFGHGGKHADMWVNLVFVIRSGAETLHMKFKAFIY